MARKYFLRPSCVYGGRAVSVPPRVIPGCDGTTFPVKSPELPSQTLPVAGVGIGAPGAGNGPSRGNSGQNSGHLGPVARPETPKTAVLGGGSPSGRPGLVNCAISERDGSKSWFRFLSDSSPVVGFEVLKNDVVAIRKARNPDELIDRLDGAERGTIEFLSTRSRRRLALVAGNCDVSFRSFVTLTYPVDFPSDGLLVKKHLHAVLAAIRRKCPGVEYLWFLEFQRRGAPHFHLFLDAVLPSPLSPMARVSGRVRKTVRVFWPWQDWLSDRWFSIVGSGDEKHRRAGASWEVVEKADGCARYVAKEAYKTFQKDVPSAFQNVGRFWGVSRGVSVAPGKQVFATPQKMAKIFPPECFGEGGDPFPVLFGGASAYRQIVDSDLDPAKLRGWKSKIELQQIIPLITSLPEGGIRSAKSLRSWDGSQMIRAGRGVKDEWHGSTCGNLTESLAIEGREL